MLAGQFVLSLSDWLEQIIVIAEYNSVCFNDITFF